jgi:hypothetical protein
MKSHSSTLNWPSSLTLRLIKLMRCRFGNAQFKQRHIPLHADITELRLGLYNPFLMEDGDDLHLADASVNPIATI